MEEINEIEEKETKKGSKTKMIIIIILLLFVLLIMYMRFVGTHNFIVKEYGLYSEKLPSSFNGLKVIHLTDIHYGKMGKEKLNKIVEDVNNNNPDIVVFTGDLYDEFTVLTDTAKEEIIECFNKINARLGKFAVSGNHDYSNEGYEQLITDSGFTYLNSDKVDLFSDSETPISIYGYPSYLKDNPNYDIDNTDNYKIALIHEPDAINNIIDKDFDLVLAGHSHGGQVRLPFIGAIRKVDGSRKYYEAFYDVNGTPLYISFGLGETEYKIRFFDRPSYNMYRIYKK